MGSGRQLLWDGRWIDGKRAPAGVYLVKIEAGGCEAVRQVLVLRSGPRRIPDYRAGRAER